MKGDSTMQKTIDNIDELESAVQTAKLIIANSDGVSKYQLRKWLKALRQVALSSFDQLIKETK
jgi:hypothetical protein